MSAPTSELADGIDAAELRAAMGHFATGVAVVTCQTTTGEPIGSTANAVSSVSLDPPLVLVCLREESLTLAALLRRGAFAINVLGDDQQPLAEHFARRGAPDDWRHVGHSVGIEGAPVLDGALASLQCTLHDVADGGDHKIVIARVREVRHPDRHVPPLLFFRGAYGRLHEAAIERAIAPAAALAPNGLADASNGLADVFMPTRDGELTLIPVESGDARATSVIALVGRPRASSGTLVYLHRGCMLGDALGHLNCRRRANLTRALERVRERGNGVVVYHRDDCSPFSGCCVSLPDARAEAVEELRALRAAIAQLRLRRVRLLDCGDPRDRLPHGRLGLDVAVIESLGSVTRLRACE